MPKLRVTDHCYVDLEGISRSQADVADDIMDKFVTMRRVDPESGELITGLSDRRCFSLHSGRFRAATWFDRKREVVWLLAAGIHREGSPDDFYNVVLERKSAGTLYPTEADYRLLEGDERVEWREFEATKLSEFRDRVLESLESGRLSFESPYGLNAVIWAESVSDPAIVFVRIRRALTGGKYLTDGDLAILLAGVFTGEYEEQSDPDNAWQYRCFAGYVDPVST